MMLRVTYKNNIGELAMTSEYARNRIEDMAGFGFIPPAYHTIANNYGQQTVDSPPSPRIMTIKFELHYGGDMYVLQRKRAELMQILSKPGVLTVSRYHMTRRIDIQQVAVEEGERCELWQDYIVQFGADIPYFHDLKSIDIPVYREEDHLDDAWTLPLVVTSRYSDANIIVSGHEQVRPQIILHNRAVSGSASGSDSGYLIKNETIGASIKINHTMLAGETVTIDTESGDITSSISGDIIAKLDSDSFLSQFVLHPGVNHLTVINYNSNEDITASCVYNNNYVEACI